MFVVSKNVQISKKKIFNFVFFFVIVQILDNANVPLFNFQKFQIDISSCGREFLRKIRRNLNT